MLTFSSLFSFADKQTFIQKVEKYSPRHFPRILQTKKKSEMKNKYDMAEVVDISSTEQPKNINMCKDIGSF